MTKNVKLCKNEMSKAADGNFNFGPSEKQLLIENKLKSTSQGKLGTAPFDSKSAPFDSMTGSTDSVMRRHENILTSRSTRRGEGQNPSQYCPQKCEKQQNPPTGGAASLGREKSTTLMGPSTGYERSGEPCERSSVNNHNSHSENDFELKLQGEPENDGKSPHCESVCV